MTGAREIGKISQCGECNQEKTIRAVAFQEKKGWVKFCLECLQSTFSKTLKETREIVFKPEEFCRIHDQPKKLGKKGVNGIYEPHCFSCDRDEGINSLEHLNLKPLEIAKFFYDKGVDTGPIIQRLIYFAYKEALEQRKLLFEERFESGENNPILISLYEKSTEGIYPLFPETVLKGVEGPSEPFIRNLLAEVYENYASYEDKERMLNLILKELFQLTKTEERKIELGKIYAWHWQEREKTKYAMSYAS